MRDRVNVSIDHRLKQMFEDLQEIHGKQWKDLLEEATLDFLIKINPVEALEHKLKIEDENQELRRRSLARTKANIAELEERITPNQPDPKLERKREQLFQKNIKYFLNLYDHDRLELSLARGGPNWDYILSAYSFNDIDEGLKWIIAHTEIEKNKEVKQRTK